MSADTHPLKAIAPANKAVVLSSFISNLSLGLAKTQLTKCMDVKPSFGLSLKVHCRPAHTSLPSSGVLPPAKPSLNRHLVG